MQEDRKEYFKSRITTSNKTELICVLYEIYFEYIKEGMQNGSVDMESLRNATEVLDHLKNALDFKYEISGNLFSLYDFCQRQISQAMYKNNEEPLKIAEHIMKELYESFAEIAKNDDSEPMMQNTQQVSAGFTYGKNDIVETTDNSNRGFLV